MSHRTISQTHGGKIVATIPEAHHVIVRPNVGEDIRRLVYSAGVLPLVPTWVSDCIDADEIVAVAPIHHPSKSRSSGSLSDDSTPGEVAVPGSSHRPAQSNGHATSMVISDTPKTTTPFVVGAPADQSYDFDEGESEIDELDPATPATSPNKKRRGKAYSKDDIKAMQDHYFSQMALNPRPPLTGIWDKFANMVSLRFHLCSNCLTQSRLASLYVDFTFPKCTESSSEGVLLATIFL
jgi:hypothetical protein